MAKKRRKYSRGASRSVKSEMHRYKRGTAKSGKGGRGGKVKSRKQAIAIGLSKARQEGQERSKEVLLRDASTPPARSQGTAAGRGGLSLRYRQPVGGSCHA